MATWYVHHSGSGASPGVDPGVGGDWSGAFASLTAATGSGSVTNGDTIKVSNQHNFSGSVSWTVKGSLALPLKITCVDHNDTSVETTGAIETGSTNYAFRGHFRIKGIHVKSSSTSFVRLSETGYSNNSYENCIFEPSSAASLELGQPGVQASTLLLINCKIRFNTATGTQVQIGYGNSVKMIGGAFADTGTVPNQSNGFIVTDYSSNTSKAEFHGVDFSNITAGKVFANPGNSGRSTQVIISRCKFSATVTDFDYSSTNTIGSKITRHDADGYFKEAYNNGVVKRSLTVVKNGGLGWSTEVTTAHGAEFPLRVLDTALDLSAAKTIELEIAQYNAGGAPAALTADQCKLIVEYPDGTTLGKLVESVNISTSTQRWDDDLGAEITANITKQKISAVIPNTLGAIGAVTAWLMISKNAAVVNVDLSPTIT